MSKTMYWVAEMSTDVSTEFHIESNTNTSLKLDINKIKLTKNNLGLSSHNHLWSK